MSETPKMEDLAGGDASESSTKPPDKAGGATATSTKTTKKKKVTKKTSAKKELDLIVQVAFEIENLDKEAALAQGRQIQADTDFNLFKIGGILAVVRENGWYSEYETFQKYVDSEFSTLSRSPYRKARYLMAIYNALVESGVKWEKVAALGWTKLSVIASKLTTENVNEWIKIAKSRTVIQIQEYIKEQEAAGVTDPDADPPKSDLTTFSVKVHADQKENIKSALEKAKSEFGTEFDAVALDHIVMGYLTGSLGKAKKAPTFKKQMAALPVEEVLAVFEAVFPDVTVNAEQITVVDDDETVDESGEDLTEDETVEVGEGDEEGIVDDDVVMEEEV